MVISNKPPLSGRITQGADTLLIFVVLLFILSPSFSILKPLIGIYFPNEKLSFCLVLVLAIPLLRNVSRPLRHFLWVGIAFTTVIALGLIFQQQRSPSIADVNHITLFISTPLYILFFSSREDRFWKCVEIITVLQCLVGAFQCLMMLTGNFSEAMIFHNLPQQEAYQFPEAFGFFYRVSGLFFESSLFATYLVTFIIASYEGLGGLKPRTWLISLALIMTIVSFSTTAVLMLVFYVLFKRKWRVQTAIFGLLLVLGLTAAFFETIITILDMLWWKITATFSLDSEAHRLLEAVKKMKYMFYESTPSEFMFGLGASWDTVSWDFVSYYLFAYGLTGFVVMGCYVAPLFWYLPFAFWSVLILNLATNGNQLLTLNVFLVIIAWLHIMRRRSDVGRPAT